MTRFEEMMQKVKLSHPDSTPEDQEQMCNELLAEENDEIEKLSSE